MARSKCAISTSVRQTCHKQAPAKPRWQKQHANKYKHVTKSTCKAQIARAACTTNSSICKGKNFRTAPYFIMHAEKINYACALLSLKTMALWIYTLIATTYFFNKNGFSCVYLFFSLVLLYLFPSSSFLPPFSYPVPYQSFFFTPPSGQGLVIPVFFFGGQLPQTSARSKQYLPVNFVRLAFIRQNFHESWCRKLPAI